MIQFTLNDKPQTLETDPEMPLLWALREELGLKGTKYGCGVGVCGICTVLIDGQANHACKVPSGKVSGRRVTTIEGLVERGHPLLDAWVAEQVPQCGYCQPGQILAAAALLERDLNPTDNDMAAAMSGVLCRCGTYGRIRRAIRRVVTGEPGTPFVVRDVQVEDSPTEFRALDEWIGIAPDDRVLLTINHAEMGQGALTGLAMLLAEELEVDLKQVQTSFAPAADCYRNPIFNEQTTGGSTSIRGEWERLSSAAASARMRLIQAAADAWGVSVDACRAEQGAVLHPASGRRLAYGALIDQAVRCPPPPKVTLKEPGTYRLLGTSPPRLEIPAMVAGRALYGLDVRLPGMLVASVLRCPVFGGRARAIDADAARQVPGVREVVEIRRGVAVLADSSWAALKAREHLQVTWDPGGNADLDNAALRRRLTDTADLEAKIARQEGDPERVLREGSRTLEAGYQTSYLAHAALEPMNCVAQVSDQGCDVWVGTQSPEGAQNTAAQLCGLDKDWVRIHSTLLGGGFGRRVESDFVAEAVELAQRSGAPVQVIWTRADDLQHDFYRPAHYCSIKAALDPKGMPLAWWQRTVGPQLALEMIDIPYAIPNLREERLLVDSPIPVGAWRSVGAGQNAFPVESFIDELAHASGQDPLHYRLALLTDKPRHRAVLELAAEKAGWGNGTPGRAQGVALYRAFGSYTAQIAEVALDDDGKPRVTRIVCAFDCGRTVNPDAVRAQLEGGIVMGLSAALYEQVHIANGRVSQASFADYPILTFAEMPEIEVHLIGSTARPGGVGEPGVPPVAPAVANAVFAATGRRLRDLPLGGVGAGPA